MLDERLINYIENSLKKHHDLPALSDYKGETYSYNEIARQILKFHLFYEQAGIKQGDKVALLGKNSARWCMVYLSAITYGAVIVPVLPDFRPDDLHYIVNHSEAVILFCADNIYQEMDLRKMPLIRAVLSLTNFQALHMDGEILADALKAADTHFDKKYAGDCIASGNYHFPDITNDQLAEISYTSGTTGVSKGVMLTHNNLSANVWYARRMMPLKHSDAIVSFLPLAHTYGCAFEFLFPFSIGCHITILTRTPSPQVIIRAFQEVRPALILSVPLVIEKIYRNQILPELRKRHIKRMLGIPGLRKMIHAKIKNKLVRSFGGNFREVIIGGAPFNPEAELFFRKITFPYTVGYGMTECGPLISYIAATESKVGSCGKPIDTLEVKIDSPDPLQTIGEILIRGENVMQGYYKNEKATADILDSEGWLHSGDLGLIDGDGYLFIKGRADNMIPGSSGKNIHPEELEALLDNKYAVGESLVVQRDDRLVALIHPDSEVVEKNKLSKDDLQAMFRHYLKEINESVPSYMHVTRFEIQTEEFTKTPKRTIRRHLYV